MQQRRLAQSQRQDPETRLSAIALGWWNDQVEETVFGELKTSWHQTPGDVLVDEPCPVLGNVIDDVDTGH